MRRLSYINYNNSSYLGSNQANSCCIYYACTDTNAVNYLDIDALYPNPQSPPAFSLDLILSSTYFSADIPEWFNIVDTFDLLDIDALFIIDSLIIIDALINIASLINIVSLITIVALNTIVALITIVCLLYTSPSPRD